MANKIRTYFYASSFARTPPCIYILALWTFGPLAAGNLSACTTGVNVRHHALSIYLRRILVRLRSLELLQLQAHLFLQLRHLLFVKLNLPVRIAGYQADISRHRAQM